MDYKQYFDGMQAMFETQGWRDFQREIAELVEGINFENCASWDDYLLKKGAKDQLRRVAAYENFIVQSKQNWEDGLAEDTEDDSV